jgi:hypothetical protein
VEAKSHPGASADWDALERALAEALAVMGDNVGQFIVLTDSRSSRYVQFAVRSGAELHAEAVSNHFLTPSDALSAPEIVGMQQLGWSPPTGPPDGTLKHGSANFFRNFQRPIDFGEAAKLAVTTLRDLFQIPYPARLDYDAFDETGKPILIPTLAMVRRKARDESTKSTGSSAETAETLRSKVLQTIRNGSGNPDLDVGEDMDLPVRFNSALVMVRIVGDPPFVSIFSPVLAKLAGMEHLRDRLNELNAKVRFARLFELEGTIYAAVEVFGHPFVAEHVANACKILGELADGIDEMLQAEFGGRTAFGQFRPLPGVGDGGTPRLGPGTATETGAQAHPIGFVGPSK